MNSFLRKTLRPAALATGTFLAGSLASTPAVHAADPYDKGLEARVEALERELNTMSNDSKGKNIQAGTEVPTFVRASKNVQELVFSGEVRFRNEYSQTDSQTVNSTTQADRNRFRFRLFADYKLTDNFFAGAAIQTAQAADSGNTTFTQGFDNYNVFLWRFFVGWHTKDDSLKFILGKQPIPFYQETELLWDADISPTGVSELVKYTLSPQLEVSLIGGQFIFYDNAENALRNTAGAAAVPGGDNHDDAYLAYQQLMATFKPNNKFTLTAAGGYLFYPGHGGTASAATANPSPGAAGTGAAAGGGTLGNAGAFNSLNSSRNLSLATFDGDIKTGFGPVKLKAYGQFVYNFQGGGRVAQEYGVRQYNDFVDKTAFAAGVTIGSDYTIKKKGDYLLLAEYRQVGIGSVDPNLNDSDFNFSRLGFRGIKAAGSYAFYPWLIGTVTYYGSNNLGNEKNLNLGIGNFNASHILQVDLTAKF